MDRDRMAHLQNMSLVGNKAKDEPSKDFSIVNGKGTDYEA